MGRQGTDARAEHGADAPRGVEAGHQVLPGFALDDVAGHVHRDVPDATPRTDDEQHGRQHREVGRERERRVGEAARCDAGDEDRARPDPGDQPAGERHRDQRPDGDEQQREAEATLVGVQVVPHRRDAGRPGGEQHPVGGEHDPDGPRLSSYRGRGIGGGAHRKSLGRPARGPRRPARRAGQPLRSSARTATPRAITTRPATTDGPGSETTSARQPAAPSTCSVLRPATFGVGLPEGGHVGDEVVDQHAEGREADRAAEVARSGRGRPRRLRPRAARGPAPGVARRTDGQPAAAGPVRAPSPGWCGRRRPAGPAGRPGCTAAAPDPDHRLGPGGPDRRDGRGQRRARRRQSRAPRPSSSMTPTTTYSTTATPSASRIARPIIVAGRAPPRPGWRSGRSRRRRRTAGRPTGARRTDHRSARRGRRCEGPGRASQDDPRRSHHQHDDRDRQQHPRHSACPRDPRRVRGGQGSDRRGATQPLPPTPDRARRTPRTSSPSPRTTRSCRRRSPSPPGIPTTRPSTPRPNT